MDIRLTDLIAIKEEVAKGNEQMVATIVDELIEKERKFVHAQLMTDEPLDREAINADPSVLVKYTETPPFELLYNYVVRVHDRAYIPYQEYEGTPFRQEDGLSLGSIYRENSGWPVAMIRELSETEAAYQYGYRFRGDNHVFYRSNGTTSTDGERAHNDVYSVIELVPKNQIEEALEAWKRSDKYREVEVGKTYYYPWPDGDSVAQYTVTRVEERRYDVLFSNGAKNNIQFGCPMNLGSIECGADAHHDLRRKAMEMQVAVGGVLENGGLKPELWFDKLVEAQSQLSSSTKGKRAEFDAIRDSRIVS